jgi:formate transporter
MATKQPSEIAEAAVESGVAKAHLRWDKVVVGAFLAGAYISFGGLVAISVSSGLDPATWGTLPTLFMGAAFTLGLILVVIAGSHLLTGNMLLVPIGAMQGRISVGDVVRNLTLVLVGNVLGAMFVAYFLAVQTGVVGHAGGPEGGTAALIYERLAAIAEAKGLHENAWQIFLRGVGCNWLVCLGVWIALAADSVGSKVLGMFFPIMAFVAMGFDHVVANMFFLPAGIFAGVPGLGWGDVAHNWVFAFLGNLVGAVVFVATSYWYLYLRPDPAQEPRPAQRGA